jgi:uncharacterized lipoprotein YmbA
MRLILLVAVLLLTGCASGIQRPNYGYMVPMCQQFHDKGQFGLHAQCSQSVRNVEAQVGQTIIMGLIRK